LPEHKTLNLSSAKKEKRVSEKNSFCRKTKTACKNRSIKENGEPGQQQATGRKAVGGEEQSRLYLLLFFRRLVIFVFFVFFSSLHSNDLSHAGF
jgi:hypothetical protein